MSFIGLVLFAHSVFAQEKELTQDEDDARINRYEKQLSDYLTDYIVNGYEDRAAMVMHEGGHEAIVEPGVRFLTKWLKTP